MFIIFFSFFFLSALIFQTRGEGLNYILQTCAMIRSLNVGFMMISNIHCQLIGGNLFHLRSLVLRSTDVTDDGLYEIGLGCKKLVRKKKENNFRIYFKFFFFSRNEFIWKTAKRLEPRELLT